MTSTSSIWGRPTSNALPTKGLRSSRDPLRSREVGRQPGRWGKRRRCVHASSTKADLSLTGALLPLDYTHPCCFRGSFQLQIHPHESTRQERSQSTSYQGNQHPTPAYSLCVQPCTPPRRVIFTCRFIYFLELMKSHLLLRVFIYIFYRSAFISRAGRLLCVFLCFFCFLSFVSSSLESLLQTLGWKSDREVVQTIGNSAVSARVPFHPPPRPPPLLIVGWAAWGTRGRLAESLFIIHSHLKCFIFFWLPFNTPSTCNGSHVKTEFFLCLGKKGRKSCKTIMKK